ncbi:MAG: sigma-70 family RNA polymerase sigma factor [Pseudonocardia sp.]
MVDPAADTSGGRDRRMPEAAGPGAVEPCSAAGEVSDESLLRGVAEGDSNALAELYDRWGGRAYSLARRICADETLAEDVVQEAFVAVWREPGRFDPQRGRFGTWLLTLVHHKAVDAVRRESTANRRAAQVTEDPDAAGSVAGAEQLALDAVAAGQVRDALGRLTSQQRQALGLAYYGGYTQREIAAMTGVAVGTVKSRMFAGLRRMRELLGPSLGPARADADGPGGPSGLDGPAHDARGPR